MEINDCALYLDSVKLSTISAFVTDITLLLMMLFGLYRIRRYGGLMTLGRLLWNQVSRLALLLANHRAFNSPVCSFREGVVWLLIAIVAELMPTVS